MDILTQVVLQLDHNEDSEWEDRAAGEVAAKEAVAQALQFAEKNGFEHRLADHISIGVVDVSIVPNGERWILAHRHEFGHTYNEFIFQPSEDCPYPSVMAVAKAMRIDFSPEEGEELELIELDGMEPMPFSAAEIGTSDNDDLLYCGADVREEKPDAA